MVQHLDSVPPITSRVIERVVFAAFYALGESTDESVYTEVIQFDAKPGEPLNEEEVTNVVTAIFSHPHVENAPDLTVSVNRDADGLAVTFRRLSRETLAQ